MKNQEKANLRKMTTLSLGNKNLTEPLKQKEGRRAELQHQLKAYAKDKLALKNLIARSRMLEETLKEAHTSHRQLSDKAVRAQRERDELYARFSQGVKDIKQKSEYKNVVGGSPPLVVGGGRTMGAAVVICAGARGLRGRFYSHAQDFDVPDDSLMHGHIKQCDPTGWRVCVIWQQPYLPKPKKGEVDPFYDACAGYLGMKEHALMLEHRSLYPYGLNDDFYGISMKAIFRAPFPQFDAPIVFKCFTVPLQSFISGKLKGSSDGFSIGAFPVAPAPPPEGPASPRPLPGSGSPSPSPLPDPPSPHTCTYDYCRRPWGRQ